eukprot:121471-Prymnesium_polylepis.1
MQRGYPVRVLSTQNTHELNTYPYNLTRTLAISAGARREFPMTVCTYIAADCAVAAGLLLGSRPE